MRCKLCRGTIEEGKLTDGTPVTLDPEAEWRLVPTTNRAGEIRWSPKPTRGLHVCVPDQQTSVSSIGVGTRAL